ncbi:hypothetical protein Pfra02_28700 [Pseudomonas fragi]|nr:hypothetical protein Pfra02_28700 [Pseudomonas fragi]
MPNDTATIWVPVEVQKLLHMNCSVGAEVASVIAPAIDMASMLNSTAKQAIQANAKRCRDMTGSVSYATKAAI